MPLPAGSHDTALQAPRSRADLFWSFTWLALQGFGGVLAVVQRELVEKKRWMTNEEFLEDWAVAQVLPGPNVVNLSLMLGDRYFGLRGALAALAGIMMASNYGSAHFYMGFLPGIKAFTAAVLGGIGNLKGAMLGGLLLGLIEALGTGYLGAATHGVFGSNYQDVFAFIVLIAVLVFRPSGLLGERLATRA